jgi:hypothetical protein
LALYEVIVYGLVGIGFLGLIVWVAIEARSKR